MKKVFIILIVVIIILVVYQYCNYTQNHTPNHTPKGDFKSYGKEILLKMQKKNIDSSIRNGFYIGMDSITKYDCKCEQSINMGNLEYNEYIYFPHDHDIVYNGTKYYKFYFFESKESINEIRQPQKTEWYLGVKENDLYLICKINSEKGKSIITESKILSFSGSSCKYDSVFQSQNGRNLYPTLWELPCTLATHQFTTTQATKCNSQLMVSLGVCIEFM